MLNLSNVFRRPRWGLQPGDLGAHADHPAAPLRQLRLTVIVVIALATLLLGLVVLGRTRAYVVGQNERYASRLAFHLNDVLFAEFGSLLDLPVGAALPPTGALDQSVRHLLIGLDVRRLTIYDRRGRALYSTSREPVQAVDQAPIAAALADALRGAPMSVFIQAAGTDGAMTGSVLATYVPIHPLNQGASVDSVIGAFAIEQDLSAILAQLSGEQVLLAGLVVALMAGLLLLLQLAIRWASAVINAQHAELRAQNQRLIALQQLRDDLTRLIVHDLRSPLTAIVGYLDLIAMVDESERLDLVGVTRGIARRMTQLIATILDMQRLQDGSLLPERTAVDVGELLESTAEEYCGWALSDGKDVQVEVAPDLPRASLDADLLRRLVANLLSNALKHTPSGTAVRMSAHADAAQQWMVLTVRDNGPGIAADLLPHIFQRYARGGGAKTGGSSGLGLTFCKLAAEAHGGTISVDSAPGAGSVFTVLLPLLATPATYLAVR